ncbi:unnamed protein product [Schistosoma mattheei]|uniref:Uncharacterized protein n=1 Tax=Schistosoma mattheei TaxID=31246 RepID=A0A3P8B6H6_9TREM|nr:unnamed protein product [Schistosoma mattheei]
MFETRQLDVPPSQRSDVHSGTRTQYRSLQTTSRYPLSY